MIEWTESAKRTLDEYCARAKARLAGSGADAEEVSDDLRRHVEEEVRTARLGIVTEEDVRRILTRLGEPMNEPSRRILLDDESRRPGYLLLLFSVLLPTGTIAFELITGASAGVLFDPLPNWLNTLAAILVPVANFWMWWAGRSRDLRHARLLGWLNGAAIGVCLYYALIYLPIAPFAALGVIYFGLGLLPLTPHLALLATSLLRKAYRQRIRQDKLPGALGILAGFGFMVLLQLPAAITYYGMAQASATDSSAKNHGVQVLRTFGDKELLLRACYGLLDRDFDLDWVRLLASGHQAISSEVARETYYRVTGQPFNSVPPPSLYTRTGRWTALENDWAWDDALGGEAVAGRVKGLSLASSRMDAVAEPEAANVYCEWTMEFKNISRQQREARVQIALPPGAVVSRLTLWIDGEEREAAFGGRAQVREAYKEVAVVQRRDPVLVTTCGPDRVLMQCFPVPPNGGMMKVRVGITAPLVLESLAKGNFIWPRFLERNFGIAPDFQHTRWLESPLPLNHETNGKAPHVVREAVTELELATTPASMQIQRPPESTAVWTPQDMVGSIIQQMIQPLPPSLPARVVIVLDGSIGMQSAAKELAEVLTHIPVTTELTVLVASDESKSATPKPQPATPAVVNEIRQHLGQVHFVGGQDNLPALAAAWDLAAARDGGVVVWIHQPQPVLLSSESALRQRMERTASSLRLFEIQTLNGPDRILEKLDGLASITHVVRLGSLPSDLEKLVGQWTGQQREFQFIRTQTTEPAIGSRVGKHLERLWARDEAGRLAARRQSGEAVKLAALNQLVTPLTGAVVLETKAQYDRHNLKPADPMTVPVIPEPSAFNLVVLAAICLLLSGKHRGRIKLRQIR